MTTYFPAKVGTQYVFYASLVSQANTKLNQVNPTIASGDFKVSIDGGALANLATLPVVTPAGSAMVKFTLSTSEMAGANATVVCSDAAGAEWCDATFNIPTTARQIDDLAFPATSGRSIVVDASGLVDSNTVKIGPTGAGTAQTARDVGGNVDAAITTRMATYTQPTGFLAVTFPTGTVANTTNITAGTITTATSVTTVNGLAANAVTAAALATDAVNEIADGLLDRDMSTGTDSGTESIRTVRQALRFTRNKVAAGTVYKENDSTASWTYTTQTDAAALPVIAIDPT